MKLFLTALAVMATMPAWADPNTITLQSPETNQYGLVDPDGNWIIAPIYDGPIYFHEGLALARQNGKSGYITPAGAWAYPAVLEAGKPFSEGLAAVKVNGKWGYTNTSFAWAIEPQFSQATDFQNGMAKVKTDGGWGVVNLEKWIINAQFTKIEFLADSDLILVSRKNPNGPKPAQRLGLVDPANGWVLNPEQHRIAPFGNGWFSVRTDAGEGLFAPNTGWIIEPQHKRINALSEGLAVVKTMAGPSGLIDDTGAWVLEPTYEWVYSFEGGLSAASHQGLWGFLNSSGEWAIEPQFQSVRNSFSKGFAMAQSPANQKWGYIDKTGHWSLPPNFEILDGAGFSDDRASACLRQEDATKCGFIDHGGAWVIEPQYKTATPFEDGFALVSTDTHKLLIKPDGSLFVNYELYDVDRLKDRVVVKTHARPIETHLYRLDGTRVALAPAPPAQ